MRNRRITNAALALAITASGTLAATGALGQDDGTAPSMPLPEPFTARLSCGEYAGGEAGVKTALEDHPGNVATDVPLIIWRFRPMEVSDPRMGGQTYGYLAGTVWEGDDFDDAVYSALWHVVNDGGEWIGPYTTLATPEFGYATNAIRLEGRGGYEGQYAVIQADFRDDCGWDVSGYILERDLPDFPEPMASLSQ